MREFSLEQQTDPSCRFDWDVMRVYDGEEADPNTLIGTYCGETVPYYFRSTGRKLYVNFKSDNSQNAKGFQAAYYFVPGRFFFLAPKFPIMHYARRNFYWWRFRRHPHICVQM